MVGICGKWIAVVIGCSVMMCAAQEEKPTLTEVGQKIETRYTEQLG